MGKRAFSTMTIVTILTVFAVAAVAGDGYTVVLTDGSYVVATEKPGVVDGTAQIRLANGTRLPLSVVQTALGTGPFEGADVANLGSEDVNGLDLWTWAVGAHVPITDHLTLSVAYERPFSHHKGIFHQRVTTMVALEF